MSVVLYSCQAVDIIVVAEQEWISNLDKSVLFNKNSI